MAREKIDKWLKLAGKLLIYTYIATILVVFMYAKLNPEQFTYQEVPINQIDLSNLDIKLDDENYYTAKQIKQIKTKYYLFYLFNTICLLGYMWFDPDKRKTINKIEHKMMRMLK